uniref:Uncharacterized protein n=1 Tax=Percolomonas cosmopolitus TaxID=63605 RepID=A0A7S1KSY9_9EUKA|eukprot:CAMPEP_0117434578 /NCGR_PEP_ID=MMETSP0759-20121206/25_1 /TAXON_ID=63605 /ORGANISM="Percolomonas cosmopolitus, Strain WS" /LENGTH=164 /DNA_ID=CAMNT_0005226073 /DNA_START=388 /DNA_END=882 /DNA_ORIENTATION=+
MSQSPKDKEFKYPTFEADKIGMELMENHLEQMEKNWKYVDPRRLTGERLGKEIAALNNLERPHSFQGFLYKHRNHPDLKKIPAFNMNLWQFTLNELKKIRVVSGFGLFLAFGFYQFTHSTPANINYESFSAYPFGAEADMDGGIVHYGYLVDMDKWRFADFEQA